MRHAIVSSVSATHSRRPTMMGCDAIARDVPTVTNRTVPMLVSVVWAVAVAMNRNLNCFQEWK